MENTLKRVLSLTLLGLSMVLLVGCGAGTNQTKNKTITNAKDLPSHLAKGQVSTVSLTGYDGTKIDDVTRDDVVLEDNHGEHNKIRYVVMKNYYSDAVRYFNSDSKRSEYKEDPLKLAKSYADDYTVYNRAKELLDKDQTKKDLINDFEKLLIKEANLYYKLEK